MKVFIISNLKKERSPYQAIENKYLLQLNRINTSIINIKNSLPANIYKTATDSISYNIKLDYRGKLHGTEDIHKLFNSLESIYKNLFFYIGDDEGLFPENSPDFDLRISMSKMVFNHFLIRVMLMEQIYRVQCIFLNHPYHK